MGRPTSKVLLRLDNGELVGEAHRFGKPGNDVVRLTVQEASAVGRLSEKDVDRLRGHVREAAALNGSAPRAIEENGYKTANGKRPGPPEYEAGIAAAPPAKRKKVRGTGSEASLGGSAWNAGTDFRDRCLRICDAVKVALGPDAITFEFPVDAAVVPDYYNIITEPICFQEIRRKLALGAQPGGYRTPQDFYDDVHRLWTNCTKYNGRNSLVGKMGSRGEAKFEECWAGSGFDGGRHRRATAGIAAAKFEPNETTSEKKPKKSQYDGFKRNGKRLQKHQDFYNQEMPREQMEKLAEFLGDIGESDLEGVIGIIKDLEPERIGGGGDSEIELSFDDMQNPTLWRLYEYMKEVERRRKGLTNGNLHAVDSDDDSEESDG